MIKIFGAYTALVTPMHNGKVDEDNFAKLVDWQIKQGIEGLVPCGTTGESPTLTHEEHNRVISICCQLAKGKIPVMAGTGSNSTDEAIATTEHAAKAGANSALIVAPYYNKPTDEGIYQHFAKLNEVGIPLVVYNVPGRSVIDLSDNLITRLAELTNVVAVKDATGDLSRISSLRNLLGTDFNYLSGDDFTSLGFNAQGGNGTISVTANIAPALTAQMQQATRAGNYAEALKIHEQLIPLHQVMFAQTSPIPAKYATSLLGFGSAELRLPLVEPNDAVKAQVRAAMEQAGLLRQ